MEESSPLHPLSHYATTKQDAEAVVLSASTSSFHPTVLRLGTLFGLSPRPRFDLLINRLTVQAACARKIVIYNGEQWRPFVHVADAARGFEICMNASPSLVSGEIYNLADDSLNLRLSEISRKIEAIVPTVTIEYKENEDKRSYRASCRKIRNRLGFVSMYSVEYGIQEILYALLESASPRELSLIAAASQDLKLAPAGAAHVQAAGRR